MSCGCGTSSEYSPTVGVASSAFKCSACGDNYQPSCASPMLATCGQILSGWDASCTGVDEALGSCYSQCGITYIDPKNKIKLSDYADGLAIPLHGYLPCASGDCDTIPDYAKFFGRVVRRGQSQALAEVPLFDIENSRALFRFDSAVKSLPKGRYLFHVMDGANGAICQSLELEVTTQCCMKAQVEPIKKTSAVLPPTPELVGLSPMYDQILNLDMRFTRPLERSDTALPLTPQDAAALCALVLCKPVELIITDCVNTEIIKFSGCTGSSATILRGQAGTQPTKFPTGSAIRFAWTATNTTNAVAGC
jgi:hypothetical protein